MPDCLVLDCTGQPLHTLPWQDALSLTLTDRAFVLDEDTERMLRSPSYECALPRVVMLKNFVALKVRSSVPFSRRNIALRDDSRCQYCGVILKSTEYQLEHVLPRSRGGLSTWTNLVVACMPCNSKKANKTPEEAGMKLLKQPKVPSPHDPRFNFRLNVRNVRPEWKQYLDWGNADPGGFAYWNCELEK